jgi:membrane-bound lytic murein transglycosylase B
VKHHIFRRLLATASIIASMYAIPSMAAPLDMEQASVRNFIERMEAEHGLEPEAVRAVLAQAEVLDIVLERISSPSEGLPWDRYRNIFITQARIDGGVAFWEEWEETIDRAAADYGVDARYLVAIVGVESNYGLITGRYRVIDALATLSFEYPPRSRFFMSQLEQFFLLAEEAGIDLLEVKGSYAGAMGSPQFIPESIRRWGVDYDEDGRIDLWSSWPDIIGSVARYLADHGWQAGDAVAFPATLAAPSARDLVGPRLEEDRDLGELYAGGVMSAAMGVLPADTPARLLELETADGPVHHVVLHNFHVITTYNISSLYGMAVHELALNIAGGRP